MDRRGFSVVALTVAVCLGCTETFAPPEDAGGSDTRFGDGLVGELPAADSFGDIVEPDVPRQDTTGEDSPLPDSIQPPIQGPLFRVWMTGGASISENNEFRIVGGIRPGDGVPSGDGQHWLIPVFRVGPSTNEP